MLSLTTSEVSTGLFYFRPHILVYSLELLIILLNVLQVAIKEQEFQMDLKALPERRRRTFLRYLAKLKTG